MLAEGVSCQPYCNGWPDDMRLSDLESCFVCQGCGCRGADVRPDFEHGNPKLAIIGAKDAAH